MTVSPTATWRLVWPQEKHDSARSVLDADSPVPDLSLNMFCQYIYLWMYVIPAADL